MGLDTEYGLGTGRRLTPELLPCEVPHHQQGHLRVSPQRLHFESPFPTNDTSSLDASSDRGDGRD